MNETEEQQVNFLQTYEKCLELCDELQEDPDEVPSFSGLYSGPVRPQAASPGRPGRSNTPTVVQSILLVHLLNISYLQKLSKLSSDLMTH